MHVSHTAFSDDCLNFNPSPTQDEDRILHVILTIPLGLRHMRMTLDGTPSIDEDPDCGTWEGTVQVGRS